MVSKSLWGHHNNEALYLITISNGYLQLTLSNLGCTIVSILMPGENEHLVNMVLSYNSIEEYLKDPYYVGCIIGRYANRIRGASFNINHVDYELTANDGKTGNHLHGGYAGFDKKVFSIIDITSQSDNDSVQFYYKSVDGEEGYPGNLDVYITYTLTPKNEIVIDYTATADKTTHINLTNHSYFNLSGLPTNALNHELLINSDYALEADNNYIPTGKLNDVKGSDIDFNNWRRITKANTSSNGFNTFYKLKHAGEMNVVKAGLRDPFSKRRMLVKTSLPGVMLYTGDFLGKPFIKNQGICLETQFFPDSPHHSHFPSTLLQPGNVYRHQTVYQFFNQ